MNLDYDLNSPEGLDRSKVWLNAHLKLITQGGTWVVPRSMSIITCDHENKRATVRFSMMPDPSLGVVFKAIGWEYKERN